MNDLNGLRFTHDRVHIGGAIQSSESVGYRSILNGLLATALRVQNESFPRLAGIADRASERLLSGKNQLELFVKADTDIQACCYLPGASESPVVLLSSSIVERLDEAELCYVIGHEIGHWAFRHSTKNSDHENVNGVEQLKILAASRCAEISADRAGLVACGDLNSAISALIKVSSGLDSRNIRFDTQSLLKQYSEIVERGPSSNEALSTHPFFLLRVRALVLFSRTVQFYRFSGVKSKSGIDNLEVDENIRRDLRKISGLSLEKIDDNLVTDILVLASLIVFAADGKFAKNEQSFFNDYFGDVNLSSKLKLIDEFGVKGMTLQLRQKMSSLGGVSSENEERMRTFFSILNETFPSNDTSQLNTTLNSIGFV